MLDYFFRSPNRLVELRYGPLTHLIDEFAAALYGRGYSRRVGKLILRIAARFSWFLKGCGVDDPGQVDKCVVQQFLAKGLSSKSARREAPNAIRHLLDYLCARGLVSPMEDAHPTSPLAVLLETYDSYLRDVRGLMSSSRTAYLHGARRFLAWREKQCRKLELHRLTGPEILEYVMSLARLRPRRQQNLCSMLRVLLGFLRWQEILEVDLARVVPRVPCFRLDSVPRHLPWNRIRSLIDSIETRHPTGLRDRAILLLIATLGLRSLDVWTLRLDNIAWRLGELRLSHTKGRRERILPLSQELGEALSDYVLHGRPRADLPFVFLRAKAPHGPLVSSCAIASIVRRRLRSAGIEAPSHGAHLLRHSLATRMVNTGVPIKQIADVLGHVSIDTTAIYTKVDTSRLSAVALPFPGGVS